MRQVADREVEHDDARATCGQSGQCSCAITPAGLKREGRRSPRHASSQLEKNEVAVSQRFADRRP